MDELRRIAQRIQQVNGQAFLVGGSVRDKLLGIEPKDFDVEVFGIDVNSLVDILSVFGKVDLVGASFGVIKLTTQENAFDFSLPRTESKVGKGHKGFVVSSTQDQKEASARRDFTFNSMSVDVLTGELVDFFDGHHDLESRMLRATSLFFFDDPLRVLRGFQFAGRFEMTAEPKTIQMCHDMLTSFFDLSKERVWCEWEKWAVKSVSPSFGLEFLRQTHWIGIFAGLWPLIGLSQDSTWHPEGDAWEHTLHAVDSAVEIAQREKMTQEDRLTLVFSSLLHDVGKAATTTFDDDGHIRSRAHDTAGEELVHIFMRQIGAPSWLIERVKVLVGNHMFHIHNRKPSPRAIRRLSVRIQPSSIKMLCWVMECDHSSRPPLPKGMPEVCQRMLELAEQEQCKENEVEPLVMGRDLIDLGIEPGPIFGKILRALFKAQVSGVFVDKENAMRWAKELI